MIIQILFFLLFPAIANYAAKKSTAIKFLSPVLICYVAGLLLANMSTGVRENVSVTMSEIAVPLAIPLLLFSSNIFKWFKNAKQIGLSFLFCIIGVTISSTIASFLFRDSLQENWKLAGMMVGIYTGGTPNMSAIGLSLNVNRESFILLNAADILLGGIYLIFLMTIAKYVLSGFLPKYKSNNKTRDDQFNETSIDNGFSKLKFPKKIKNVSLALSLSIIIFCIGILVSYLIKRETSVIVIIIVITSMGIGCSMIPQIRELKGAYNTGEYILLIFCIAIGSLADFNDLLSNSSSIFYFCMTVLLFSIIIHYILAAIFKIDTDTVIITSAAGIMGPAFVGPIAGVLKNRNIILSGMMTGVLGYAVGNYFGIALAYLLRP